MNVLTAENVSKSYGMKTLFDNISFTISDSDKIGLIGLNGTGKSNVLEALANIFYHLECCTLNENYSEYLTAMENWFLKPVNG